MDRWTVAAVQMDCRLGRPADNLAVVRQKLAEAAAGGARLVVFPELALTGYGLPDRAAAVAVAEPVPGPATAALAADCDRLGVWAVVGLLERAGDRVYNAAALVSPGGRVECYRKVHLPCVGADRFVDPGDRPFAVHDLGGLRVGLGICFDLSFPEAVRVHTLLGADLIVLPTNWAEPARRMATLVTRVRALENRVYVLACNRVGDEAGHHYLGHSSVTDVTGDFLAAAEHDREAVVTAVIDPAAARQKRVVTCAGEYEIDRVNWRRPEFYARLTESAQTAPSAGAN
jgi:predicted amidohydrolase